MKLTITLNQLRTLSTMLKDVSSKDETRAVLNTIRLSINNESNTFELCATDGLIASKVSFECQDLTSETPHVFLIDNSKLNQIKIETAIKSKRNLFLLEYYDNNLRLNGEFLILCDRKYPNIDSLWPNTSKFTDKVEFSLDLSLLKQLVKLHETSKGRSVVKFTMQKDALNPIVITENKTQIESLIMPCKLYTN